MFYRMALLLLVLAATSAQQLVVQTHWHAVSVRHAVAASASGAGSTDDGCLLCRIAAHAGAAAPPAVLRTFTAGSNAVAYIAAFCTTDAPAVPAHAWQSRGPPAAWVSCVCSRAQPATGAHPSGISFFR